MEKMLYLYIFAFLVLSVILLGLQNPKQTRNFGHALFKNVVCLTMLMIIVDMTHEYLNGVSGTLSRIAILFLSIIIYALPAIISLIWFYYVHELVYYRKPKKGIGLALLYLPIIVNTLVTFASAIWPLYFEINSDNIYSRGNIYFLSLILQYFHLLLAIFMVLLNRKKLQDSKFYPLAFFAIPPMVGGLIQAFNYGLLLIWPAIALSVHITYIFIQSQAISTDYLTGLMNKGAFENYIENIKYINNKNENLAAVVMDLDGLKNINDNYGHHIGDEVLQRFAQLITDSFHKKDYLARVGGDEFLALTYVSSLDDLRKKIENLKTSINTFNADKTLPIEINFSFGYDLFNQEKDQTIKQFLERVDSLMYKNKAVSKVV